MLFLRLHLSYWKYFIVTIKSSSLLLIINEKVQLWHRNVVLKMLTHTCTYPITFIPLPPYQVVNAQQQGLDAAGGVGISGCADGQETPQELWQEL